MLSFDLRFGDREEYSYIDGGVINQRDGFASTRSDVVSIYSNSRYFKFFIR